MGAENPWRRLRARPDIILRWADLDDRYGGAIAMHHDGQLYIVLDNQLDYRHQRRSALCHELVHLERGVLPPSAPPALRLIDEARVRAETARRLVPLDELREFAAERQDVDEPVTAHCVAERFDVTVEVALEACRLAS